MTHDDLVNALHALGARFQGVDIQFRRHQPEWPQSWRVRIVASKNERDDFRITAWGDSFAMAATAALEVASRQEAK